MLHLPRIANFDDFDPLQAEPAVNLRLVDEVQDLGRPDLVIIPGTKATVADLAHLRRVGLADAVVNLARAGVPVIGICGGYQMLGTTLRDPLHVESAEAEVSGLGLLPVATTFAADKSTWRVRGRVLDLPGLLSLAAGEEVEGYEIHMGQTEGAAMPVLWVDQRSGQPDRGGHDGAASADGLIVGTYWHGLFERQGFRQRLLAWLAKRKGVVLEDPAALDKEREYDRLAAAVRESLDMRLIYDLVGLEDRR